MIFKEVDCLGYMCPMPVMHVQKEIPFIQSGQGILLITDHSCAVGTIQEFCAQKNFSCSPTEVIDGVWEIAISANI